eukprot:5324459-Prymnesium_polylepis.1
MALRAAAQQAVPQAALQVRRGSDHEAAPSSPGKEDTLDSAIGEQSKPKSLWGALTQKDRPAGEDAQTQKAVDIWINRPSKASVADRVAGMTAEVKSRLSVTLKQMSEDMEAEDMFEKGTLQEMETMQRAYVGNLLAEHKEAQNAKMQQIDD